MMEKRMNWRAWVYPVLFMIYVVWTAPGAFPLVNYEGDANSVLGGVSYLLSEGEVHEVWSYGYSEQPLTYWLIGGLSLLTGMSVEGSYCLLCWLGMLWLGWLAVAVTHRLTGIPRCILLVAWWLLPESYACGFYGNSAVLATPVALAGIWLILHRKYWLATLVLCIAPLIRVDVACIYPVVFPLMCWLGMDWRKSLGVSALMAVAVTVVAVAGIHLLGGVFADNFHGYLYWNSQIPPIDRIKAIVGCYSVPGMLLILAGILILLRRKEYLLWAVLLVPLLSEHFVYRKMGCAAKHFLYALPFAAAFCAYTVRWMVRGVRRKRPMQWIVASLMGLYVSCYVVVPVWMTNRYEHILPAEKKRVPRVNLFSFRAGGHDVSVGIGGGMWFGTADELLFMSGNLFYPVAMHNLKAEADGRFRSVMEFIDGRKDEYIAITYLYDSRCTMLSHLQKKGWRPVGTLTRFALSPGKWQDQYLIQTLDMSDGHGKVCTTVFCDIDIQGTSIGEKVTSSDNALGRFVKGLNSDRRPIYIISPGYVAFVFENYMENLEEEGIVRPVVPGVWEVPAGNQ